jgi:hypothetical protein
MLLEQDICNGCQKVTGVRYFAREDVWHCEGCQEYDLDIVKMIECPRHGGAFDCTPFCPICEGEQEYPKREGPARNLPDYFMTDGWV